MNNIFSKTKTFIKNNKWWTALIAVIVLVTLYFVLFRNTKSSPLETVMVEKRNITEEVSVTGKIAAVSSVDLSFEKGGHVSNIAVSVGDMVYKWQYLASISNADLVASVEQAKANLKIAEVNMESLRKGSTPEQIALDEARVQKAGSDLMEGKNALINSITDAYTKSDDSIRNKTDIIFIDPKYQNVELKFTTDFQLNNDIKQARPLIETVLDAWSSSLSSLNINSNTDPAVTIAKNNLETIKNFLEKIALAVNNLTADSTNSQTTIDTWKANISAARTNIALAISGLSASVNQYSSSLYALKIAENQLAITKSGATTEQISAQEAAIDQAKASLDNVNAQLEKSILRSPIDGVITKVDIKAGEVAQVGMPAVSVISLGKYEVESFIPEADIAKIKIGNVATTTLDAYGSDTYFKTSVVKIDPAETMIEGIPTYKVTLIFMDQDGRVKSGMTANMDILTNQKFDVLAIPTRSTYTENSNRYVNVVDKEDSQKTIKTEIKTGLRSVDGYIEITSGLNGGDKIVASPGI